MKNILKYQLLLAVWTIAAPAARSMQLPLLLDICYLFILFNFFAVIVHSFIYVVSWFNPRPKSEIPTS